MRTTILLTASTLFAAMTATANPLYQVTAEQATACRQDGCRAFPKGYRFEASNWGPNAREITGTSLFTGKANEEPETYIFHGADVAPILDAQGNMTEPACQWPTGGVMQHAVTDAQGLVYIKRVEATTKCVNGKMTTIQRALN
ncbi:hypothetical protein QCE62_06865 [Caballeronia sp. LZ033]|uniref:hypothetical protein n=1 Tax=Caballeronia sp. LZ033 TaxID=3038566 RepID=UPI00285A6EB6|nr:hypothetical protein [Caballeronia sp. LZ033]MDR5813312.1 hypothetical protein [Caballeronia sp. LZ033]